MSKDEPVSKVYHKRRIPLWVWIVSGIVILVLGIAIFVLVRFMVFKEATFGGRNEASLITRPAVTAPVTHSQAIQVNAATASVPTSTPVPLDPIIRKIKNGERISVLILGYGGGKHDGANLTDTILQVVFDPSKKTVSMINIPRDTYVFIPYGGLHTGFWGKANSAFSYIMSMQDDSGLSSRYHFDKSDDNSKVDAAANLTKDVVESVTGQPVDYWMAVSFEGFRDFIDAIDGITVNVETAFDDYEYPRNDDPSIDASYMHIHFDAGVQHMNGEKAIQYSRSRHSIQDGTDFGRSKRQMNVLSAVKEQVNKPDMLLKALPIMNALQGKIRTSLSFDQVLTLANYFRSAEGSTLASNLLFVPMVISSDNFLTDGVSSDGGYILYPYAGIGKYTDIQEWIEKGLEMPLIRKENVKVQIQNATGLSKPLSDATQRIEEEGFNLIQADWANNQPYSKIIDYSNGKGTESLKALKDLFPEITLSTSEVPPNNYGGPDIVIMLGKDFNNSKNNLLTPTPQTSLEGNNVG